MKTALICILVVAGGCGTVTSADSDASPPDAASPDASTGGLVLTEGHIATVTVDDGFEQTSWSCAGTACVQGGIRP